MDVRLQPELVKSSPEAPIPINLDPEHTSLEDFREPHEVPQDKEASAIRLFLERLTVEYEDDYGDFMREANSELHNLEDALSHLGEKVLKKLRSMQQYTQFTPTWDIETTRQKLFKDGQELLKMISMNPT